MGDRRADHTEDHLEDRPADRSEGRAEDTDPRRPRHRLAITDRDRRVTMEAALR